ncbi:hypothetical protein [Kouleothrix sp.]|uniref:hypothetical protein n=1 Tax=Kouleothrix sp. TaxID=2779161 RepID=UPI00391909DC
MKQQTKKNIQKCLKQAQVALTNALSDSELQEALERYGYSAERLAQGKALYDRTQELYQEQHSSHGAHATAIDALETSKHQANRTYMRYVKVARVAFKNNRGALQALLLQERRHEQLDNWLGQARQFYNEALADPALLAQLARFGISEAMLQSGRQEVEAVADARSHRQKCQGAALTATSLSTKSNAELADWMADFTKIARVALEHQPQQLAKLSIVRQERPATAKRAAAAPKAAAPEAAAKDGAPEASPEGAAAPAEAGRRKAA